MRSRTVVFACAGLLVACAPGRGDPSFLANAAGKADSAASLFRAWVRVTPGTYDGVDLSSAELLVGAVSGEHLEVAWEWARQQGLPKHAFTLHVCKVREVNRGYGWTPFSCATTDEAAADAVTMPPTAPGASPSTPFVGIHDCGAAGSPIIWAPGHAGDPCDADLGQLSADVGGRTWITVVGYVGGSFLEGYQVAGQGRLNFHNIPAASILLRLDSASGRAFPPIREDADYDRYGAAVVEWLATSPGSERVALIQLGNEHDQYLAEYPAWEDAWSQGQSDEQLGLTVCDFFGPARKIQYMTPARYAKLFVAVARRLRSAGMQQRLVTSPPMPMRFAQHDGNYSAPNAVCIDNSVGDYLRAIADEASARGLANPIGGIGLHLQGVGHDDTSAATGTWLQWSIDDAHTVTAAVASGARFRVTPAGRFSGFSAVPVFISEIHPPPPFWGGDAHAIERWVVDTADGVKRFNARGGHQIRAVTFYRLKPGSDVPFGANRAAVLAGIRRAVAAQDL